MTLMPLFTTCITQGFSKRQRKIIDKHVMMYGISAEGWNILKGVRGSMLTVQLSYSYTH